MGKIFELPDMKSATAEDKARLREERRILKRKRTRDDRRKKQSSDCTVAEKNMIYLILCKVMILIMIAMIGMKMHRF